MDKSIIDSAKFVKAIGNPHRLHIVQLLGAGAMNVTQLNAKVKVSQPALSQHLSKLRRYGVVTGKKTAREVVYSLKSDMATRIVEAAHSATAAV